MVLSFYFHSFYYLIQSVILLLSKIYNLMNYLDVLCKYKVPFKKIWVHKTSLIMPLFIGVSVPSQESERSCLSVRDID